ncbi:MAG: hypothetical protein HKO59_02300 [Phycisphaerales bacterium]|nr:hypothetical protein [Phycisphaerales bacterium]NNM24813.1 hypothetical protein [Phycisphaerales bacterium]
MPPLESRRGPWFHRLLVWVFSIALGLLVFWLLGFAVGDLGSWPGPVYAEIERETLAAEAVAEETRLRERLAAVESSIAATEEQIGDLRESTSGAEQTLNRLLEIQRLSIEKERVLAPAETEALAEAKTLFLANQRRFQALNQTLVEHKEERRGLRRQHAALDETLEVQREEARRRYAQAARRHSIKMASLKLAVLIPLLLIVVGVRWRWRESVYRRLVDAVGLATAVKIGFVMHEYFPSRAFKYVLVGVSIVVVAAVLVWLLRRLNRPPAELVLRQFREAYQRMICPVCEHPIRRGPLRYLYWNRRSVAKLSFHAAGAQSEGEEPYVCPACATPLYATCEACQGIRPTLLPACPHCGAERGVAAIVQAADADKPAP